MKITPTHVSLSQDEIYDAIMMYLNESGIHTSNRIDIIGVLPRLITVSRVRDDRVYLQCPLDLRVNQKF
ncbi:TPA: hypothetical protein JI047_09120 [Acinetobacter baumannii]|nr:hypothetical protein A7L04_01560 [Acinetobacter baumannii]OIB79950.1 hypothetical protein A7L08_08150 [Acinetobacter baumannii]OIF35185.1 hypothetical protein A7M41_08425 [Acinetobacter baumannii]HAV5268051.1 hypothetical protein [Acinetobacter baumannii]HAV5302368.1 hypothetical protein [Acinetobacter baumannii]